MLVAQKTEKILDYASIPAQAEHAQLVAKNRNTLTAYRNHLDTCSNYYK